MKVSGFTFLRDAALNGYPFVESIKSLLPIVDEYVIAIGRSGADDTRKQVEEIGDPKIRIIDTCWNESMSDRGFVYGQQKMIAQFNCTGDWAFYLEGDEVIHEADHDTILSAIEYADEDLGIEALTFDFLHFYGTPQQIGIAGYRTAPRIIRNTIRTIAPDGLFWVVLDKNKKGRYPRAVPTGAKVFHYGHCRKVESMRSKVETVGKYWGNSQQTFKDYGWIDLAELRPWVGDHPSVMQRWLESNAELVFQQSPAFRPRFRDYRNRVRFWLESKLGLEISKKHFSLVKR